MDSTVGQILFLVLLTLLEGFFVASEIALVAVRRSRIDQLVDEGSAPARRVRRLLDDPGRFLAVAQIGLTFIGFFASAFAAVSLVDGLRKLLESAGMEASGASLLALIVVTIILSLFTIVFAELVPKTLALSNPERYALVLAVPVDFIARLLGPVIALLTGVTRAVTGVFGVTRNQEAEITAEELRLIVERGGEQGVLEAEEDLVIQEGHSRVPVYEDSIDEVVGILYAKDLLPYLKPDAGERPSLRKLLRAPVLVPESMTIDDLLHELQRRKVHLAIVLDEYGGTAGMVTIEDLLEEIVGEIQDEYDVEEPMVVKLSETEARVDGRADVDALSDLFDDVTLELEDSEEYDTVGGLVFHRIGKVPTPGDRVQLDGITITVESTDGRRVGKVLVVHSPGDPSATDAESDR